ncbi:hypothetical protein [Nonomuraea aurantiaca]|uniref:hypothetical protein n=1 Tax=Nonomuraea aurantiaca TaxID=2878562 RepID=UPI001CD9CD59|nr:hypothetical protein [Nonomuraea aurantiaca]MCA2229605.1 hypothetical protein [Nonomuraea aurantiaca]
MRHQLPRQIRGRLARGADHLGQHQRAGRGGRFFAAALGMAVAPALLRCHAHVSRWLLDPTKAAVLARRVSALTTSRSEINDA